MSAFKKIPFKDYSIVPFNANKHYNFNSSSAAANKITYHNSSWTSQSIDLYNSGNIKYDQLDHLFYRNYKNDVGNKLGNINYLKQKRVLSNISNILSIPAGLYGHKIKKESFFLSSSGIAITDDSYGNLIVQGTNIDDYITDPRSILLDIGPVKGFKKYDLNTINDFILDGFRPNNTFYKKGKTKINIPSEPSELFLNGAFTGVADTGSAFNHNQFGPLLAYNNAGTTNSASIENEQLVIRAHTTNRGARFDHPGVKGTTYELNLFTGEGDTGSIYVSQTGYGGLPGGSIFTTPNTTSSLYYTAVNDNDIKVYFRANLNLIGGRTNGTSSFDNISIKEKTTNNYSTLSSQPDFDDSYFSNNINYKNVLFHSSSLYTSDGTFPVIGFNGYDSEIKINHNSNFNFNPNDDFSIEFWVNPQQYSPLKALNASLIEKSTTETILKSALEGPAGTYSLDVAGSSGLKDVPTSPRYPFSIYLKQIGNEVNLIFEQSDGDKTAKVQTPINIKNINHVVCIQRKSLISNIDSTSNTHNISIYVNGLWKGGTTVYNLKNTQNNANIYIGNKGGNSNYFSGSLSQIKIFNKALTNTQVTNHYKSSNGSPYIGNIFYSNGLVAITHPDYSPVLSRARLGIGQAIINPDPSQPNFNSRFIVGGNTSFDAFFGIQQLQFQGSHLIHEYEYQCTIDEYEFNNTLNPTARKNLSEPADFTTSSIFKPYITTVGLYNENNELLVVGKLGQPIRTSDETDTTLVIRWDT